MKKNDCLHIVCRYDYYSNGRALVCNECDKVMRFDIGTVCPSCLELYDRPPAISRRDGVTNICSDCGLDEALQDMRVKKE